MLDYKQRIHCESKINESSYQGRLYSRRMMKTITYVYKRV